MSENNIDEIIEVTSEETASDVKKNKVRVLTLKLNEDEWQMVKTLKARPHYVNIAQYVRDSLLHLYQTRTNKAGRVKSANPEINV